MKNKHSTIIVIFVMLLTVGFVTRFVERASPHLIVRLTRPNTDLVNQIEQATDYLVRNTLEDGMYNYRINTNPEVKVSRKYNILRHAGSIYSMVQAYQVCPNDEMYSAIKQAGRYLQQESLGPLPVSDDILAIWSRPEVNGTGKPVQGK